MEQQNILTLIIVVAAFNIISGITIKATNSVNASDYAQRTITLFISDFEITASPTIVSLRPGEQKDIDLTISSKKDDVNNNLDTKSIDQKARNFADFFNGEIVNLE